MIPLHLSIAGELLGIYVFRCLPLLVCGSHDNHLVIGYACHANETGNGVALAAVVAEF